MSGSPRSIRLLPVAALVAVAIAACSTGTTSSPSAPASAPASVEAPSVAGLTSAPTGGPPQTGVQYYYDPFWGMYLPVPPWYGP